jgi:NADPH-dependent 2,4-dienoyl-CoA reductase/sulfur reductase-like enzyme
LAQRAERPIALPEVIRLSEPTDAHRCNHRVVVVGGGFGGLEAVKAVRRLPVDVTLIDRHNYHLFQPLTYQVATAALSPDEIAEPLRAIFRRDRNVRALLGEVTQLDLERRVAVMRPGVDQLGPQTVPYETLVARLAPATRTSVRRSGRRWRSRPSRWTAPYSCAAPS